MNIDFEAPFSELVIDLEVDFGEQGGIQRFKNISQLNIWLTEENEFWNWLRINNCMELFRQALGNSAEHFFTPIDNCIQQLRSLEGEYNNRKNQYIPLKSEQNEELKLQRINDLNNHFETIVIQNKDRIASILKSGIVQNKTHFFRGTLEAGFVKNLSETDKYAACFALAQFIQDASGSSRHAAEFKGRTLAFLYSKNWIPKKEGQKLAYAESIKTWVNELGYYKDEYERLLKEFQNSRDNIDHSLKDWDQTAVSLQNKFELDSAINQQDLNNLKETYESFMQLHGPMGYWRGKRREHNNSIKKWSRIAVVSAIGGIAVLVFSAYLLLPEATMSLFIPWRKLVIFLTISAVIIWLLRFPFKMLLSNIHLSTDAREREVMISTYMALLRGARGVQGISKEQLEMLLTPIFRPATSGVIKDDGVPLSMIELITRLKG